jgi:hypothetical protein
MGTTEEIWNVLMECNFTKHFFYLFKGEIILNVIG